MRKKKIKKLAKLIFIEAGKLESKKMASIDVPTLNGIDYDKEVSDKFYHFVSNLVKLRDRLCVEVSDDFISIYGDLNINKKSNNPIKENRIEIKISKEGFTLVKDYSQSHNYQDILMLERIRPQIVDKFKKVTKESMLEIIDDVMINAGLSRENNLDEILKD
jgi:hypothetical protein